MIIPNTKIFEDKYIILEKLSNDSGDSKKSPIGSTEIQGYCAYELKEGISPITYLNNHRPHLHRNTRSQLS
jgi:hypothetical protein